MREVPRQPTYLELALAWLMIVSIEGEGTKLDKGKGNKLGEGERH